MGIGLGALLQLLVLVTALTPASPSFQLAAVVAEYAEILSESYWARGSSLEEVMVLAQRVNTLLPDDPDVTEFADLNQS